MASIQHHWQIRKQAVSSRTGLVSSQHYMASDVGADILSRGGNAIDAAIATGLTLGVVEPWMSGIGGGGYMTVYLAETDQVEVVEFGMQAPLDAVPEDYPLAPGGTNAGDAFNWPAVTGDTNIHGPLAAAVPGYIRGIALALEQFGTWSWTDIIDPACRFAEQGLPVDWFACQKINQSARGLRMYAETSKTYLEDGLPPNVDIEGHLKYLPLGRLAATYRTLQAEGPEAFYTGVLAGGIVQDLSAAGSKIRAEDLAGYRANIESPLSTDYRGQRLYVSGDLTAGPSIIRALGNLESRLPPGGVAPDEKAYQAYAESLLEAYSYRLSHLGEGTSKEPGSTSHICAVDKMGNVVSLTQTIMSPFGARIMLPASGILMNNGMMWFDPRPGGPNSVVGGRRPLCNMCPVIIRGASGSTWAIGACGGRKIFPAVFQLASFVTDFHMTIDEAVHTARLDVSGTDKVTLMDHASPGVIEHLQSCFDEFDVRPNGVSPTQFALPQILELKDNGEMVGGCFVPSPHAKVSAAS